MQHIFLGGNPGLSINVKFKKHIITNKVRSVVFPAISVIQRLGQGHPKCEMCHLSPCYFLQSYEMDFTKQRYLLYFSQNKVMESCLGHVHVLIITNPKVHHFYSHCTPPLAGSMLSHIRMQLQTLDCVTLNTKLTHAAPPSQAISQG